MSFRESASHYLITLCGNGDLKRLSWALQRPCLTGQHYRSFAQVALATENVLICAEVGTIIPELNLHRMLCVAARSGHEDVVELLLAFGTQNNVPVSKMVTMDTMDAALQTKPLEVLLKFQAVEPDVFNQRLHLGSDILYIACHGGPQDNDATRGRWLGFVQHLLDVVGRDANTPNARLGSRRYRPGRLLYNACQHASLEIVDCLLEHGAAVKGSRAMRSASANGRIDVLESLLRHGGDVNELAEQETGDGPPGTPLHVAAAAGREDAIKWLLGHGADDGLKNSEGRTAREIWKEKGMELGLDVDNMSELTPVQPH